MRSARSPVAALALASLVGACKPSPVQLDASTEPPFWVPAPGEAANWDIQIAEQPVDISEPRDMYLIDLFDAVPGGITLDYGGGSTLAVPAGRNATAIATLRARSPRPIVVCLVGTGAIRLDDPDASRFLSATGTVPDRPTRPAADSLVGWSTPAGVNERFLNQNEEVRSTVTALVGKRLELAKQIGCDAVAANIDDTTSYDASLGHGFDTITDIEYRSWMDWLTTRAHELELSIGLRDGSALLDAAVSRFDWHLVERCAEYEFCDMYRGFLNARKAVFAVEYNASADPKITMDRCKALSAVLIRDGIVKSAALDASFHARCP